jgi:hypothetical protein
MRHGIIAFFAGCALATSAMAGAQTRGAETWAVGGSIGFGQTWNDESSIGQGLLLSGHLERRLIRAVSLECSVDWLAHERHEGVFQAEGHTTIASAAVKYSWRGDAATGYTLGGIVVAHHSGTTRFEEHVRADRTTMPGWTVGGGVSFPVARGWHVGPEGRMVLMSPGNEEAPVIGIYGGVRLSLPFGQH